MLVILFALGAIIAFWLMYKAIVYASPCLLGLGVAYAAINTGAGWVGAALAGLVAAVSSFFVLRFLLGKVPSTSLRWTIGALLALPTALIGYHVAADALSGIVPALFWQRALATIFALTLGAISIDRMIEFEAPGE